MHGVLFLDRLLAIKAYIALRKQTAVLIIVRLGEGELLTTYRLVDIELSPSTSTSLP